MARNKVDESSHGIFQQRGAPGYFIPDNGSKFWADLSNHVMGIVEKQVAEDSFQEGVKKQTERGLQYKADVEAYNDPGQATEQEPALQKPADGAGFGTRSKAFAKGENAVFAIQKKTELDTAMFELKNKHATNPKAFKAEFEEKFLPKFLGSLNTNNQAAFNLEATERFNRTHAHLLEKQQQLNEQKQRVTMEDRVTSLQGKLYNLIASGAAVDPDTGSSVDEIQTESSLIIRSIAEREPARALQLQKEIGQTIREAEWLAEYERTPDKDKEKFVRDVEAFKIKPEDMRGEFLTPTRRSRVIGQMKARLSGLKNDSETNKAVLRAELTATVNTLMTGVGSQRDLNALVAKTYSTLDKEQADLWNDKLVRAQEFSNVVTALKAKTMPEMGEEILKQRQDYLNITQQFEQGKVSALDYQNAKEKHDALEKFYDAHVKLRATDPWLLMDVETQQKHDLQTPDGVFKARTWLSNKTGLPIYRISPMSKAQADNFKADLLKTPSATEQAQKLMQLKQRVGEDHLYDVLEQMELPDVYAVVALSNNPATAGSLMLMLEDGKKLQKSAPKADRDVIRSEFNSRFGNSFGQLVKKGEAFYDMYERFYLALQKSEQGVSNPGEIAFRNITEGRKVISLPNNQKRLVPVDVDEQKLVTSLEKLKDEWRVLGIRSPYGVSLEDMDPNMFSVQVNGHKAYFTDGARNVLRIRSKDGMIPLQMNLKTYDFDRADQDQGKDASWNPIKIDVPLARTSEGRLIVPNDDGTHSTERTITVTDPQINGGKPTNIPTMFEGKQVSQEEAIQRIVDAGGLDPETGRKLQGFKSIDEAVKAAEQRSKQIGKGSNIPLTPDVAKARQLAARDNDPANRLDKIANGILQNKEAIKARDVGAFGISSKKSDQLRLQSLSMIIRQGDIPDWTYDYIRNFPALRIADKERFEELRSRWKTSVQSNYTLPSGAPATPLELLAKVIRDVNREKFRHDYPSMSGE